MSGSASGFSVLVVCFGNQCRSPAVRALLTERLARGGASEVTVRCAGTFGPPGRPLHPFTAHALSAVGVAPFPHRARLIDVPELRAADLVLAADRSLLGALRQLDPHGASRTFTVLEFAWCAAGVTAGCPAELVHRADQRRALYATRTDLDLPDPIRGSQADHERMVTLAAGAVEPIAAALAFATRGRAAG